ncbi:MAG: glycosyltransferase family 2 protein [Candidatus Cloacimonetes bacterium]|nr:glycosyltransferase family 2 protein [Candidatus Cloacimonadota bacterium]
MKYEFDVSVIIPAYNEEVGIKNTLEKLTNLSFNKKVEVIVVNDGSTDRTAEISKQFSVRVINHTINKGYGASLKTGIRKAKGEKVIFMDSDGQHDPSYLPQMIEMLDDYEMVIGERDKDSHQVKSRLVGKTFIRLIGEYLVSQKLPDYNSGLRGFHRDLIFRMLHVMPNGFSFSTTSTLAFLKEGYQIGTFPITVKEREGRTSSVKFFKDGAKTLLLLTRVIMLFNPLKIFFPVSVFITTFGFFWGLSNYIHVQRFSNTGVILCIIGVLIFLIGLLADQIAILNRK